MMWYAQLNDSLDAILGQYTVSRTFRRPDDVPVRFGAFATDQDFFDQGLYKIVEDLPTLTSDEQYGDQTVSGDSNTMIATVSREVITKTDETKRAEIEQTYQTSLEAARGSVSDLDLNLYQSLWEEIKRRQHDPSAPVDELEKFATARGVTAIQAIALIRDILKPIKEAQAEALGARDKALAEL